MNINDLMKKLDKEARARHILKVERDTELFIQVINDWSHYFEYGGHKHDFMWGSYDKFIEVYEPYCLYFYIGATSPAAIAEAIEEYSARGFDCKLSRDGTRFMISSAALMKSLLEHVGYKRDIFIPDIEVDSNEFYAKLHDLVIESKDRFDVDSRGKLHRRPQETLTKINKIAEADPGQTGLLSICEKFGESIDRLFDELVDDLKSFMRRE